MPPSPQRLKPPTTSDSSHVAHSPASSLAQPEELATPQLIILDSDIDSKRFLAEVLSQWHAQNHREPQHSEVVVLGNDGGISIDEVRNVRQAVSYGVSVTRYRHVVLHVLELGSEPAQQALLKLLEEPAARTQWWLTTHNPQRILPTIQSRCHIWSAAQLLSSQQLETLRADSSDSRFSEAGVAAEQILNDLLDGASSIKFGALVDEAQAYSQRDTVRQALLQGLQILHNRQRSLPENQNILNCLKYTLDCLRYLDANVTPRMVFEHWLFSLKLHLSGMTLNLEKSSAYPKI